MRNVGKMPLCHMRTAKVRTRMRIRAVRSRHSLFVDIYYPIHWFCKRKTKAQISLRKCACWSGPVLSANCIRALFVREHRITLIDIHVCEMYISEPCRSIDKMFLQPNILRFFLNASRKKYVVGTHLKGLLEALQMSTHNICFYGEVRKKSIYFSYHINCIQQGLY